MGTVLRNIVNHKLHPWAERINLSGWRELDPLSHGPEPCMLPIHYTPVCPWRELNPHLTLRTGLLYPLSYGDVFVF